jgi:hypothetical protein
MRRTLTESRISRERRKCLSQGDLFEKTGQLSVLFPKAEKAALWASSSGTSDCETGKGNSSSPSIAEEDKKGIQ